MMVRAEKETAQGGSLRSALKVRKEWANTVNFFFGRIHFWTDAFCPSAVFHPDRGACPARSDGMRLAEWIKCFLPSLFRSFQTVS